MTEEKKDAPTVKSDAGELNIFPTDKQNRTDQNKEVN